jgi:hypothetical protein
LRENVNDRTVRQSPDHRGIEGNEGDKFATGELDEFPMDADQSVRLGGPFWFTAADVHRFDFEVEPTPDCGARPSTSELGIAIHQRSRSDT